MTHCGEKWVNLAQKHPEVCKISESYRRRIDSWIDTCESIIERGFDRDLVFKRFPEGAHRELPPKTDSLREKALNYVCDRLKKGESLTGNEIKKVIKGWREPAAVSCPVNVPNGAPITPLADVKNKNFFAPLQDGKPVPDPATLAESMRGNDKPAAEPENIVPQKEIDTAPPCKDGKPCPTPDGRSYLVIQEQLGNKCSACGAYLTNLTYCPILQRQKAAEQNASMFTTGGKIKALDERAPAELPRVAQNQPMELRIRFNAKQWKTLKQIVSEDLAEDLTGAVLYLVDEAGERMGGR